MSKKIIVKKCTECPYLTQVLSRTNAPYCVGNNKGLPYTEELCRGIVVKVAMDRIPEWCNLLETT